MSYIRAGHPLKYVEGNSEDYIFLSGVPKNSKHRDYIEDYGKITDKGFIELLFMHWETKDNTFKEHLLKRLAKRLDVILRDEPLSFTEMMKIEKARMKQFDKNHRWWVFKNG